MRATLVLAGLSGMSRRTNANVVLLILLMFLASACGDPGYDVSLYNQTGVRVTVEVTGTNEGSPIVRTIEPGGRAVTHWLRPASSADSTRATVIARSESGAELFCSKFSYDEVKGNFTWRIDVTTGVRKCE